MFSSWWMGFTISLISWQCSTVFQCFLRFCSNSSNTYWNNSASIYLSKVDNRQFRTVSEMNSRLTIMTLETRHVVLVSIVNFQQNSHVVLVLPLLTLKNYYRLRALVQNEFKVNISCGYHYLLSGIVQHYFKYFENFPAKQPWRSLILR